VDFISTKEDAESMMEMANLFIERMKKLIEEMGEEISNKI